MRKYRDTVDQFNKKLTDLSEARNKVDEQRVETAKNYLESLNKRDVLNLHKQQSSQEVAHLTHDVKIYKDQLSHLARKYADFLIELGKVTKGQEGELKKLGDDFRAKEDLISKMTVELKNKTIQVNDLH